MEPNPRVDRLVHSVRPQAPAWLTPVAARKAVHARATPPSGPQLVVSCCDTQPRAPESERPRSMRSSKALAGPEYLVMMTKDSFNGRIRA